MNKEYLNEIIKVIELKIQAAQRDNARTLRQLKASQRLQISDLEQILNSLNNLLVSTVIPINKTNKEDN